MNVAKKHGLSDLAAQPRTTLLVHSSSKTMLSSVGNDVPCAALPRALVARLRKWRAEISAAQPRTDPFRLRKSASKVSNSGAQTARHLFMAPQKAKTCTVQPRA